MLRRFPRRNRSAIGCVSPCLPEFQRLLLFFPLAGSAGAASEVSGNYWTATRNVNDWGGYPLSVTSDVAYVGNYVAYTTGCSVRCVRAREGQAIPCFFPLAGSVLYPEQLAGQYWTSSIGIVEGQSGDQPLVLTLRPGDGFVQVQSVGLGCSVRCVRAREGQAIPCFFPLAGNTVEGAGVSGWYWCSDGGQGLGYYGEVRASSASAVGGSAPVSGYSVRCVRAREEQAVPRFWIVWFWVL